MNHQEVSGRFNLIKPSHGLCGACHKDEEQTRSSGSRTWIWSESGRQTARISHGDVPLFHKRYCGLGHGMGHKSGQRWAVGLEKWSSSVSNHVAI